MANIKIQKKHQLSTEQLKDKIDVIMLDIRDKIEFQSEWKNNKEYSFRRKGANGRIEIDDSNFELNLNLGIMYRALKIPIEQKIIQVVNRHIN